MRFMSHNWSATKQHLHTQSVAEISRHSVLPGDSIRQCETSSGSRHKDTDQCRHFLLQTPQCPCSVRKRFNRDRCCRGRSKPGCRIVGSHTRWELTTGADFRLCLHRLLMSTLTYQVTHIPSIYCLAYPTQLQFTVVFLKVPLSAQRSLSLLKKWLSYGSEVYYLAPCSSHIQWYFVVFGFLCL